MEGPPRLHHLGVVDDLLLIAGGTVILAMIWSDRHKIPSAWRKPARFWRTGEYMESREPSQPFNWTVGLLVGIAAIVYGVLSLIRVIS
jgi:hypothetical protein